MRRTLILLLIVNLFIAKGSVAQIADTCYREGNLPTLFKSIESDEALQLERLTAFHFHQLINQHRIANRQKTLSWDDNLWLAARNHCVYMNANGQLSHSESASKEYFTGSQPETRTNYVTYHLRILSGSGENILYTNVYDDDLEVMAINAAAEAFEIWKNSLGHNQNMLSSEYFAHGTAFIFGNSLWATTVFASPPTAYSKDDITISWDTELAKKYPSTYPVNDVVLEDREWRLKNSEIKMFNLIVHQMKSRSAEGNLKMHAAATHHLEYMKKEGGTELIEKKSSTLYYQSTSKKRFLKATHQFGMFKLFSNKIHEITFSYTIPKDQLVNQSALEVFEHKLLNEYSIPNGVKEWGGLVNLIEENGIYTCYVDILMLAKKK